MDTERIQAHIDELEQQMQQFIQNANQRIGEYRGAITAYKDILAQLENEGVAGASNDRSGATPDIP